MKKTFRENTLRVLPFKILFFAGILLYSHVGNAKNSANTSPLSFLLSQNETINITGTVKDTKGIAIPGASISVIGTTKGTLADIEGNFSLNNLSPESKIKVAFMGFKSKELPIGTQKQFDIQLESENLEMDEVVVVAYGVQKKSNLTGSVSAVNSEKLTDVTTPNASNMLQSKASGVYVTNSSGQPGADATIRIRGKSSLNNSVDPLWVVDGVVASAGASSVNPNEIESISVLKDASATALYGSRAANGVIVVTTKSGKQGTSTISGNANVGVTTLYTGNFSVMNSEELYNYEKQWGNNDTRDWFSEDLTQTDTDWFKQGSQTGVAQDYSISFTGGTQKVKAYILGSFYKETGAIKGYDFSRYNVRVNLDYKIKDWFSIRPKLAGSYKKVWDQQHFIYDMYLNLPWDNPYNEKGDLVDPKIDPNLKWYGRDQSNYMYDLQWNWKKKQNYWASLNIDGEIKINDKINFVTTNNYSILFNDEEWFEDPKSVAGMADQGRYGTNYSKTVTRFSNQLLRYNNSFGTDQEHSLNAFMAYEYSDYYTENVNTTMLGIASDMQVPDVTARAQKTEGTKSDNKMQSFLFNSTYSYSSKYFAQFSIRVDGSSKFGKNKRYGTFATGSLGWTLSKEAFLKDVAWLDILKLRASYGSIGNTPDTYYGYAGLYEMNRQYNGVPAGTPYQIENQDLTWEKTLSTNIAIDAGLFNKINFSIEYYKKNTSDLLYFVKLPSVTGYKGYWANIGQVNNQGIEFTLSPNIIDRKGFVWDLDFNIGMNRNKVDELYGGISYQNGNKIIEEGEDIDTWYMPKWLGVDPTNGDPLWEKINEDGSKEATNNYSAATYQKVGTSTPDFYGGLMSNMSYKGFSLGMNFAFVSGNMIYHYNREFYDNDGAYPNYNAMKLHKGWSRWEKPGDKATHPKSYFQSNNLSNKVSSRYLEKGNFIRMKNLTLGWNLPQNYCKSIFLSSAKLTFSADNLWVATPFSGIDPEVGDSGTADSVYPQTRKFIFGINVTL